MGVDSFSIIDNQSYASDPNCKSDQKNLDFFKRFFSSPYSDLQSFENNCKANYNS